MRSSRQSQNTLRQWSQDFFRALFSSVSKHSPAVKSRSLSCAPLVSLKTLSGSEVKVSFIRCSHQSQNTLRQWSQGLFHALFSSVSKHSAAVKSRSLCSHGIWLDQTDASEDGVWQWIWASRVVKWCDANAGSATRGHTQHFVKYHLQANGEQIEQLPVAAGECRRRYLISAAPPHVWLTSSVLMWSSRN